MFKKIRNNKKWLLFGALGIVIVIIIIILFLNKDKFVGISRNSDGEKFKNEYEELNDKMNEDGNTYPKVNLSSNNMMKYSSIEEILDIFDNQKSAVIYFGFPTCLYCRSAIEVLCDVASKTDLDAIYYLDAEEVWDVISLDENNDIVTEKEANPKYDRLLEILGEELTEEYNLVSEDDSVIETGERRLYTPLVVFVSHGLVVSYNKGTLFSQVSSYNELDESQKRGLAEIYRYGINDVLEIQE